MDSAPALAARPATTASADVPATAARATSALMPPSICIQLGQHCPAEEAAPGGADQRPPRDRSARTPPRRRSRYRRASCPSVLSRATSRPRRIDPALTTPPRISTPATTVNAPRSLTPRPAWRSTPTTLSRTSRIGITTTLGKAGGQPVLNPLLASVRKVDRGDAELRRVLEHPRLHHQEEVDAEGRPVDLTDAPDGQLHRQPLDVKDQDAIRPALPCRGRTPPRR